MSCQHGYGRLLLHQPKEAARDSVEIDGTWDFKWQAGTTVRVAFQELPDDPGQVLLREAIGMIANEHAAGWGAGVRLESDGEHVLRPESPGVPLTLLFLDRPGSFFPAPAKGQAEAAPGDLQKLEHVFYDVLVSLADLPIAIKQTEHRPGQLVSLPRSELGRYARRLDFGLPSAFLGPFGRRPLPLIEHLTSDKGRFIVSHELGHILGLVHPFQQHDAPATAWREPKDIGRMIEALFEVRLPDDDRDAFIANQLTGKLPAPSQGQETLFSDLRPDPDEPSIMSFPFLQVFEANGPETYAGPWPPAPTKEDQRHLERMYEGA